MKEKLLKVKEQIMQNKKKAAAIGIAVLLLIGAGGYGIVALNMDNKETAKAGLVSGKTKTTVKKTDKKDVTDKKIITDKKTEDKKSSNDKKEVKNEVEKKEDKKEAAKGNSEKPVDKSSTGSTGNSGASSDGNAGMSGNTNTGSGSGSTSGGNTQTPTPEPTPEPEPPVHVHSFDIPIWSEKPETVMTEIVRCSACHEDITWLDDESLDAHIYNHMINGENGGYYSSWEEQETGNMIPYISGYKCSCGAVQ